MSSIKEERPAEKFGIKKVDELFGEGFDNSPLEIKEFSDMDITRVSIDLLQDFKNHPFRVVDDVKMDELVESIKLNGILYPLLVRKIETGGLEVIAGHRRKHASMLAGLEEVPVIIKNISDEDAAIIMVDSNIQREDIFPSEKAKAYRIKMDAIKRKGQKLENKVNSAKEIGEGGGDSERQVNRYIRLSYLIPELLHLIDVKVISAFTVGVPLAYLNVNEQNNLYSIYKESGLTPNSSQAKLLKEMSAQMKEKNTELSIENIKSVLGSENAKTKTKLNIDVKKIKDYFPEGTTVENMEEVIFNLLKSWNNKESGEEE